MIYYHGSASTFEKPILRFGLRPSDETWRGLRTRPFGPSAVWFCDSFEHAMKYARLAAGIMRARMGQKIIGNMGNLARVKLSPACDPYAQPIVFAIEIDESKYAILPSRGGEFRVLRGIPPEALTLVLGPRCFGYHPNFKGVM